MAFANYSATKQLEKSRSKKQSAIICQYSTGYPVRTAFTIPFTQHQRLRRPLQTCSQTNVLYINICSLLPKLITAVNSIISPAPTQSATMLQVRGSVEPGVPVCRLHSSLIVTLQSQHTVAPGKTARACNQSSSLPVFACKR
jgi:hypothetical protein